MFFMQHQDFIDADKLTSDQLRQKTCDFLYYNRDLCCPVDCPYLDLVNDPSAYCSFDDFISHMRCSSTYAEYLLIHAAHMCFEINIIVIHYIQEEITTLQNDTYLTTVTLGNLENHHFVRAKHIARRSNAFV